MGREEYFTDPGMSRDRALPFLQELGFSDPFKADQILSRLGEAPHLRELLAGLAPRLFEELKTCPDPDLAVVHLHSFCAAVGNLPSLLQFLLEVPPALSALVQIAGTSPYLSQSLIRSPDYFYWLLQPGLLEEPIPRAALQEQARAARGASPSSRINALRRLRRREILRIAGQDLLGFVDFPGVVGQISDLADVLLQATLALLEDEFDPRLDFTVLALGKLGGRELNYSSDVDLLYLCSDECDHEAAIRFARKFTRAVAEVTSEGHLFRVDLRLRPMGRSGEIIYPLKALQHYYSSWGDTFDRLALLKCRRCAGSSELAAKFLSSIQGFVYRKYLDHAAVEEISWLKQSMDREQQSSAQPGQNVKVGQGGIREIEYFIQSFQLLYAGQDKSLRTTSTLELLDRLVDGGYILSADYRHLSDSYRWLREVEHRLQLVHNQPSQVLPPHGRELTRLARTSFGEPRRDAVPRFEKKMEDTTAVVHRIFTSLFLSASQPALPSVALNPKQPVSEAMEVLQRDGVRDAPGVYEGIKKLLARPSYPQSPARVRNLLANLLPDLLAVCEVGDEPGRFFGRFSRLISAFGSAESLLRSLLESPVLRASVLEICLQGGFLFETLLRFPELLDSLAEVGELQFEPPGWTGDSGLDLEVLRRRIWKDRFKIGIRRFFGGCPEPQARRELTSLADELVRFCFQATLVDHPALENESITLFGLGTLGSRELTFYSDLDLICVYDDGKTGLASPVFNHWIDDFRKRLSEYSEEGGGQAVDLRLRPEGRRSSPATPLSAFEDYWAERAEPWEAVAYSRLREIAWTRVSDIPERCAAALKAYDRLDPAAIHSLRMRKEKELAAETAGKKRHVKSGYGGLLDIQIVASFLLLGQRRQVPNTLEALAEMETSELLASEECRTLEKAWIFLSSVESGLRLIRSRTTESLKRKSLEVELVARLLEFEDSEPFLAHYQKTTDGVREIYLRVFSVSE